MLNYIRAELYKVAHRPYPYIFLAVMLGLELLMIVVTADLNSETDWLRVDATWMVVVPLMALPMGLYFSFIIGDMVFSDQYKHGTLKNEISFGIPRTQVYLGKLITECILGLILLCVMMAVYLPLILILFPGDRDTSMVLQTLGIAVAGALPLYFGAMGVMHLSFFNIKSSIAASLMPAAFLAVTGPLMLNLSLYAIGPLQAISKTVYPILLTTPFDRLNGALDWPFLLNAWAIGFGWLLVTTVLGLFLFHKKEIN